MRVVNLKSINAIQLAYMKDTAGAFQSHVIQQVLIIFELCLFPILTGRFTYLMIYKYYA